MSNEEDGRLQELGVMVPSMVDGVASIESGEEYWCPALREGRCTVYDARPAICRLWGATISMPCPHGCTPDNALSKQESDELLALAGRAGGGMAPRFFHSVDKDAAESHDLLVALAGQRAGDGDESCLPGIGVPSAGVARLVSTCRPPGRSETGPHR